MESEYRCTEEYSCLCAQDGEGGERGCEWEGEGRGGEALVVAHPVD